MPPDEHIHIISAGENIPIAYPAIFRMLPSITSTYVIADSDVYDLTPNAEIDRKHLATRKAVDAAKEISASLSIPFSRETVFSPVYPSVLTILTKIYRGHPGARFTFDLSGGSKELCLALFAFAPWLGGEVYAAFEGKTPRSVPLPDQPVRDVMENPNYQTILAVLIRKNKAVKGVSDMPWVTRPYLYSQVWPYYTRSRTRKPKPGDPVANYHKGRKPAQNLSQATFSSFTVSLRRAGLMEERLDEKNRKEKVYRVTEKGDMAFRFYADPATSSNVKMVLEDQYSGPMH